MNATQQMLLSILGAGGGVSGWVVWYIRSGRASLRLSKLFGDERKDLHDLRFILNEQRKGYDHLVGRVDRLENEVVKLETQLSSARKREESLQRRLRLEKQTSGARIEELERQLCEARQRIEELEQQLTFNHPPTP